MAKSMRYQPTASVAKESARSQSLPDKNLDDAQSSFKEKIEEALSPVIAQGQRAQVIERVTRVFASEIFTGPVPHPKHLAEYEKRCPGIADRIMMMAEKAQETQERRKDRILELEYTERKIGLFLGFFALVILSVSGVIVSIIGHEFIGEGLVTAAILGAAITPFIQGRNKKTSEKQKSGPRES